MAALFLEPLLHGFRRLRELFRTLSGETTTLETFFLFCGHRFFLPGWETGYVDFNREQGRRQGKKPNTVESIDGVIERDDIEEIVWEVQV